MGKIIGLGFAAIAVLVLVVGGCAALTIPGKYNSVVSLDQQVQEQWGQVENVYQRRADLIPNIMATVEGYAAHERETFKAVTEARAKVGQINLKADQLTPENMQKFQAAQDALSGALSRLMVVVEKYPNLKAVKPFMAMMTELAGTENRIATERRKYNQVAREYNTVIKSFPFNLLNGMFFHFTEKNYFKADEGADKAPKVKFTIPGTPAPGN